MGRVRATNSLERLGRAALGGAGIAFSELVESMEHMNEIARGEGAPSREFHVEPLAIKELCSKLGLSQPKFAKLVHVDRGDAQLGAGPAGTHRASQGAPHRDPPRSHAILDRDAAGEVEAPGVEVRPAYEWMLTEPG